MFQAAPATRPSLSHQAQARLVFLLGVLAASCMVAVVVVNRLATGDVPATTRCLILALALTQLGAMAFLASTTRRLFSLLLTGYCLVVVLKFWTGALPWGQPSSSQLSSDDRQTLLFICTGLQLAIFLGLRGMGFKVLLPGKAVAERKTKAQPLRRGQFSLGRMLAAVTLFAIVLAVLRTIGPDWLPLFPREDFRTTLTVLLPTPFLAAALVILGLCDLRDDRVWVPLSITATVAGVLLVRCGVQLDGWRPMFTHFYASTVALSAAYVVMLREAGFALRRNSTTLETATPQTAAMVSDASNLTREPA